MAVITGADRDPQADKAWASYSRNLGHYLNINIYCKFHCTIEEQSNCIQNNYELHALRVSPYYAKYDSLMLIKDNEILSKI